jgi:hypothetical protein
VLARAAYNTKRSTWPEADARRQGCKNITVPGGTDFTFSSLYLYGGDTDVLVFTRVINETPRTCILAGDLNAQLRDSTDRHISQAQHVSIDVSYAFCRVDTPRFVDKLFEMETQGARWLAGMLTDWWVANHQKLGETEMLAGEPETLRAGPMPICWTLDVMVHRLEEACRNPIPGCIAAPIVSADDINFAVRGFNPDIFFAMANKLLGIVNEWSIKSGIPMAKLQASWLTGGNNSGRKATTAARSSADTCKPHREPRPSSCSA